MEIFNLLLDTYWSSLRDYPEMAFNNDLSPLSTEECRTFGVREMQPNKCIPRKLWSHPWIHKDLY